MAALILPRGPLSQQPQYPAPINWGNSITRGLIFAGLPGVPFNLADGVSFLGAGAAFFAQPTIGYRRQGRIVAAGSYEYPNPANSSSPAAKFDLNVLTALSIALQDTAENNNYALYRGNGSSAPGWYVGLHSGSFNGGFAGIGSYGYGPQAGTFDAGPHTTILRADGTNASVFFDGALVGSGTYTAPAYQYSTARALVFGTNNGSGGAQQIRPSLGLVWNRPLSDAEIASINANPWQIFQAPPRKIWAGIAATATGFGGALRLQSTRTAQPQQAVPVDWSNPITQGLVNAISGASGLRDVVTGEYWSTWGTPPARNVGKFGVAFDTTAAAGGLILIPNQNVAAGATSQFVVYNNISSFSGQYAGLMTIATADGTGNALGLSVDAANTALVVFGSASVDLNGVVPIGSVLGVPQTMVVAADGVAAVNGPGSMTQYINGKIVSFRADTGSLIRADSRLVLFGERAASVTYATRGAVAFYGVWKRRLSDAEVASLNNNPWQLFKALPRRLWVAAPAVQLLRPSSDISAGTWTPSSGVTLFSMLNETVASDATYVLTSQPSTFAVGLTAGVNPGVTTGHIVRTRTIGAVTVNLMQGATVIASWAQNSSVFTTFEQTLTSVQAAAITNYAALSTSYRAT